MDENDPRLQAAAADLHAGLNQRFVNKRFTTETFHQLNEMVKDFRVRCRKQGIDFPQLKALVVPRLGIVDLVNAELEGNALRIRIVGFVRRHPLATAQEVAQALKWAFPSYKGGGFEKARET